MESLKSALFGIGVAVAVVLVVLALSNPWEQSPNTKIRLILQDFDRFQAHLERLCRAPLKLGVLSFEQTGIPDKPRVDKRAPLLAVQVSVVAPEADRLILTVTLPEIDAQGIYRLWAADPIPAGATLQSKGRCENGTLYWTRLESTLPEERLQAGLAAGTTWLGR